MIKKNSKLSRSIKLFYPKKNFKNNGIIKSSSLKKNKVKSDLNSQNIKKTTDNNDIYKKLFNKNSMDNNYDIKKIINNLKIKKCSINFWNINNLKCENHKEYKRKFFTTKYKDFKNDRLKANFFNNNNNKIKDLNKKLNFNNNNNENFLFKFKLNQLKERLFIK